MSHSLLCIVHKGAFRQFSFRLIYYCHSSESTGKETGKTYLCAVFWQEKRNETWFSDVNSILNTFPNKLGWCGIFYCISCFIKKYLRADDSLEIIDAFFSLSGRSVCLAKNRSVNYKVNMELDEAKSKKFDPFKA